MSRIPLSNSGTKMSLKAKSSGYLLLIIGRILYVALVVSGLVAGIGILMGGWIVAIPLVVVCLILLYASRFCIRLGKQLKIPSGEEIMEKDNRPIVLYLRSFKSDTAANQCLNDAILSEEEQISKALAKIGPLIAIGRPDESLPQLGASRLYATDEEWQDTIKSLIGKSQLVLLRAGGTDSLLWEIEQVVRNVRPEQIVFLLPNTYREFNEFRANLLNILPVNLDFGLLCFPEENNKESSFSGYLWFTHDWTPHLAFCDPDLIDRKNILADFQKNLSHVFQK